MKFVPNGKRYEKMKELGVDSFNKDSMNSDKNRN